MHTQALKQAHEEAVTERHMLDSRLEAAETEAGERGEALRDAMQGAGLLAGSVKEPSVNLP